MTADEQFDTGCQYARNRRYDEAIKEFTLLLSNDPTVTYSYFYRGCAYLHLNEYQKSIKDFNSAISLANLSSTHTLQTLYKRGYAYLKINQFDAALDDYRLYLLLCKHHVDQNDLAHKGLFQMGVIYAALNQYDSAKLYFTHAIKISSATKEDKQKLYYLHRGRAYACCGKYEKAQADLKLVLEQSHDQFIKGCANNELGRHHNALKEFDSLLQSNKNNSSLIQISNDHIRFRRGLSYASVNLHDKALDNFQHALNDSKSQRLSTITDRILFHQGISNMSLDHTHQALIHFNESIKLNENQSDVFYARGMIYYTLGRYNAATHDQHKAMQLQQKSSPVGSVVVQTTEYYDGRGIYMCYENKIHETEKLLKKHQGTLMEADIHRTIAEYLQKQASYSKDPIMLYKLARERIEKVCIISGQRKDEDIVALAINSATIASIIIEKYSDENLTEFIAEEYINFTADSILEISKLFDKCITNENWNDLVNILQMERDKSNTINICYVDKIRNNYIKHQLQKSEMIKKTTDDFPDSFAQQEFYKFFVIRLCNLFDGARMTSTELFSHSLEGTLTKVSWAFQLLGKLFEFVPIVPEYGKSVTSYASDPQKIDAKRIENVLNHMGNLGNQKMFTETANNIAKQLTQIYESQINQFSTTNEEKNAASNSVQQETTGGSRYTNYLKRCIHSLRQQTRYVSNQSDSEYSTIQTIVEYGISLSLSCFTRLKVKDIPQIEDVQSIFVNRICRPSSFTAFHMIPLVDTIKPIGVLDKDDHGNTYDFYRRPAIRFSDGIIRARDDKDIAKFGCRKPTLEETKLSKEKPQELDSYGLKIVDIKDNLS